MKEILPLHDAGHSLGLWLFRDTTRWFEFVLHTVLLVAPIALALVATAWGVQLSRGLIRRRRQRTLLSQSGDGRDSHESIVGGTPETAARGSDRKPENRSPDAAPPHRKSRHIELDQ